MPRPDPLTPADLRPGQRVRITWTSDDECGITTLTGQVAVVGPEVVHLRLLDGYIPATPPAGYTQTIEVLE